MNPGGLCYNCPIRAATLAYVPMPPILAIQLLGGFAAQLDTQPVDNFRSAKGRALLAYLAAEPDRDHPRTTLATLLWGDLSDSAARTNLRIELSGLKKSLRAHPALEISRGTVRFHSDRAAVDVQQFCQEVNDYLSLPVEVQSRQTDRLVAGLERYAGEFLAGFLVGDAPDFEEWQLISRERLHEQAMAGLETLQLRYAEQAQWGALADTARRQLAIVPWTEQAHRHLIQALAAQGQTQAALAQFEQCREILWEELGAEPSQATRALADRLRGNGVETTTPRHNLPQQLQSFVGRQAEIAHLLGLVQKERLVTLLGIGGVGKSRLAQAVARSALRSFADGVWFVHLAPLETAESTGERIALAIGAAVGYPITDLQSPLDELAHYLADKEMLLVLDNWEHLLPAVESVLYPLLTRTNVHILATSRARLGMDGEHTVRLEGLPPAEAAALFIDRARRIVPAFGQQEKNAQKNDDRKNDDQQQAIDHICRQVAGLPLGIELAASWVEHYSAREIGASLAGIEIEPKQAAGIVYRHHSLSNVFEYSWRLLGEEEQRVLARLSVFQGGFDRPAAEAVAGGRLSELSALIGHSLVQRVDAGRYDLHPLIQEFAAAKLGERDTRHCFDRHSRHFLHRLNATPRDRWADDLRRDSDNLRSAWQRAVDAGDAQLIAAGHPDFSEFSMQFGSRVDGYQIFQAAVEEFADRQSPETDESRDLLAQLYEYLWWFSRAIHGMVSALPLLHSALSCARDPALQAKLHTHLATTYTEIGQWDEAGFHFDRVEEIIQETSDQRAYIAAVESRIHINAIHFRGDYGQGMARLQELMTMVDDLPDQHQEDKVLREQIQHSLILVALRHGDYALAIQQSLENLARMDQMGFQQERGWVLLDLALAEQFAGLFDEAIAHNREALALAEEIGAADDRGLLSANLCLSMRQVGPLDEALALGLQGAEILHGLGIARQEGQARNRVGHVLLAMERWEEAYDAYGEALAVWEPLQHPNRYEAVAGRGLAAWHCGKSDEALALAEEAVAFVRGQGTSGLVEPALLLLNCHRVLDAEGRGQSARWALARAGQWVETIAGRISSREVQSAFLRRPDNREVQRLLATLPL